MNNTVSTGGSESTMSSLEQNNNKAAVAAGGGGGDDDDCSVAASLYSGHADNSNSDAQSMTSGTTDAHSKGATTVETTATKQPAWKMVCCSRMFILGLVVVAAAAAGTATYFLLKNQQEEQQAAEIENLAEEVISTSEEILQEKAFIMVTMSSSMSAMAGPTDTAEWPFYTQAGFSDQNGEFATSFKEDTGATLVSWSPTVEGVDQSVRWGLYSTTYYPGWAGPFEDSVSSQIEPYIFERWTLGSRTTPVEGPGPFLPMWQTVPVTQPQVSGRVNLDLLSDKVFAASYQHMMDTLTDHDETGHSVAQTLSPISLTNVYGAIGHDDSAEVGPTSMMLTPILADISEHSSVVGVLTAVIPWTVFLEDSLANQNVTVVVQSQGCESTTTSNQDTFTFNVVGDKATYVGQGDLHEEEYSEDGITGVFGKKLSGESESTCHHTITVYPNSNTSSGAGNDDSKAAIWLVVVIVIILLCAVVFFMYDYQLRLKHRQTQERANRTNAIISSLYPAEIRDRLLGRKPKNRKSKKNSSTPSPNDDSSSDVAKSVKDVSSKQKLKSYLKDEDEANAANAAQESAAVDVENMDEKQREILKDTDMYETKPIAELFPNTTVMFADLAGFTAWSSVREPSQVFTLLEAVYGAFDTIAKRRRVFKVETVGDCYVAVTGLPEPRQDHALAMARFAKECIDKFNDISKQLELTLGPDTADLAVRAGIHSGPVTAGVLRGDKSRFQLFGATVNTAARVEATGMRNRVHMSSVTAQQLVDCGKEHWVKKRAEVVTAKGKGEMQTYWLVKPGDTDNFESQDRAEEMAAKVRGDGPEHLASATVVANSTNIEEIEASLPPKIMRLVGWNVEILKKSLQAIVAKRNATNTKRNYDSQIAKREAELVKKNQLLGEVCEVISLPKFDAKAHKNQEPPNKVVIPDEVVKELRLFVSSLAASHRDVPFHNFEHASHVTMSVTKLLSRIVAPSEILDTEDDEDDIAAALHDHTFGITSDPLTQFAVILSALIHDVDHYGVSNMQLVKEDHQLAKQFNGKSVAEQNSLVLAWEKLMSPQFANLRKCIYTKPEDLDRLRAIVVNNVMATDIFDKDLNAIRRSRWEKAFAKKEDGGASMGTGNREQDINRKATVVMERLLQASDVSHTMQHWHIYQKWNERLFAEMTRAYQNGRLGFNPADGWYDGEIGFLDNYVIPMARNLKECGVFGVSSDEYLNYAQENRREWERKGKEIVATYIDKYCKVPEKEEKDDDNHHKES